MKQPITGRSVHNIVLTDSESSVLKHIITDSLRDLNDFEKELKIAENEARMAEPGFWDDQEKAQEVIAENNDLHLHTIIHPKLTEKENGKRKPPVPYDLKGGSEWFNSGKCMITIDRPDFETNEVDIYFNKIKKWKSKDMGNRNS